MIAPPRILLLGIVSIMTTGYFFINSFVAAMETNVSVFYWYSIFILTVLAFLMAIPRKFYNIHTLIAVCSLPKAFILMLMLLFKLKGADKKFIHTKHGTINS